MNADPAKAAALAALNKAAEQIYNIEGDQWQDAYETIDALINKLDHAKQSHEPTKKQ